MTINYSTLLGLAEPVTGSESGTWGDDVNKGITEYLDIAIAGTQIISGSLTAVTLSNTNGSSAGTNIAQAGASATGSSQYQIINCTGNPAGTLTVTVPASSRTYVVINATTTSQSVTIVGAGPTTGVTLVSGEKAHVAWNGSDYVKTASTVITNSTGVLTVPNGGTGVSTLSGVVYGNAASVMTAATGAQISTAIGATAVQNATAATTATTSTNLAGGVAYQVPYQSGVGATTYIAAPSVVGTVLGWSGSALGWVSAPAATTATNLSGGGAYTVVYQSSAGTTAYLTNGTTGQVLNANTGGAPTWGSAAGGTVTSVAMTVPAFLSIAGSPITSSGTLAVSLSGTALPVLNGGTGQTTLAAASIATYTGTETLTNKTLTNPTITNYVETPYTANSSTAITLSLANGTVQIITLTGNATITMPTAVSGKSFTILLKQDATGSRTVTWTTVSWPSATAPTITSTASKMDRFTFISDGTSWFGATAGQNYT